MQLHPVMVTALMHERERAIRQRAKQARMRARRERHVRSAPWPP